MINQNFVNHIDEEKHDVSCFDCGDDVLNTYIKQYSIKNEGAISRTYVAIDEDSANKEKVIGFYTLCTCSIEFKSVPKKITKNLPRYPIPCVRLARLAVEKNYQGKGIGQALLVSAFQKTIAISMNIGVFCVVVDAKNDKAESFYKKYGFLELKNSPLSLFILLKTIEAAFR